MTIHRKFASNATAKLNPIILEEFLKKQNNADVRKTHLFENRYENIYLTAQHIPALSVLMNEALVLAKNILQKNHIRAGYWFNYMPPDSSTTIHSHDDYDELLSSVYYVHVPENSGNLIIHNSSETKIKIKPQAGEFIFFSPDMQHEVSKNNSAEHRLSIGINFGPDQQSDKL